MVSKNLRPIRDHWKMAIDLDNQVKDSDVKHLDRKRFLHIK